MLSGLSLAGEAAKGATGGAAGPSGADGYAQSGNSFGSVTFGRSQNDTILAVVVVAAVAIWLMKKK